MKRFTVLIHLTLLAALPVSLSAQSFDEALELYQQEQYQEATEMFLELTDEDERAVLFTGKSLLAQGEYIQAGYFLDQAATSNRVEISREALYTRGLLAFRLKNFASSLETLHPLAQIRDRTGIQRQASRLYGEILEYLTASQRYAAFWQTDSSDIRYDLIRSAIGRADYDLVHAMILEFEKLTDLVGDGRAIEDLREQLGSRQSYLRPLSQRADPPRGTVYPIGVALPLFDSSGPDFIVSRNLYFGMTMAAEEFNSRHSDRKVLLRFRDTHADPDSASAAMHELIWNDRADAIIGPLFSSSAEILSQQAEAYEVPMVTPLANSDQINRGHNYTFQLNPTFGAHGEHMARFAVLELGLDTLAVISQQDALGEASAIAFRREAERLGAYVAYYIQEDFATYGYDLSELVKVFDPDPSEADLSAQPQVDGIYAPFTGQEAEPLIGLLLTELESMGSRPVLLGSEEWGSVRLSMAQQRYFPVYYSQNHSPDRNGEVHSWFEEDYANRFGSEPDDFSRIGYDTANFLLQSLEQAGNPEVLKQVLRQAPMHQGLAMSIHFDGSQINRMVQVVPATDRARTLMGR